MQRFDAKPRPVSPPVQLQLSGILRPLSRHSTSIHFAFVIPNGTVYLISTVSILATIDGTGATWRGFRLRTICTAAIRFEKPSADGGCWGGV